MPSGDCIKAKYGSESKAERVDGASAMARLRRRGRLVDPQLYAQQATIVDVGPVSMRAKLGDEFSGEIP
jgi:hypothetical protein